MQEEKIMSFTDELYLRLIDTGLLGFILLVAAYLLNKFLETFKGQQAREIDLFKAKLQRESESSTQIALSRLPSYKQLWALTEIVSPATKTEITADQKQKLEAKLRSWYYHDGNGIFLSLEAARRFLHAKNKLALSDSVSFQDIQAAFSDLRTQMKSDIGVYGLADAQVDINT
jgi:hypothetical protein